MSTDLETGMEGPKRRRVRRFQRRARHELTRLGHSERDAAIIRLVHEHRFLRSSHIVAHLALDGHSRQHTLRRLRLLYDHGFLDKPEEQWAYRPWAGEQAHVYALGDHAALEDHFGISRGRTRMRDRNREVGARQVAHCLLVADIMLAFERTYRRRGNVRVIPAHEILERAHDSVRAESKPFQWQVDARWEGETLTLPVVPDKVFGLEFTDRAGPNRAWFMLEADRGTETLVPLSPKNTRKPTLFHKLLAYHATYEQELHTDRYGFRRFRVLTVTALGKDRVEGMCQAAVRAGVVRAPNLYLFAERKRLVEHADVLAMPWQTPHGDTDTLDI